MGGAKGNKLGIDDDKTFYTETMARLHADQGRYDAAARIYRYLLDQTPDRTDLAQALETVLSMIPQGADKWEDVSGLIERWARMVIRQKALKQIDGLVSSHFSKPVN